MTDYISMTIPCETDPISLSAMNTFAQQADAGLATVEALADRVTHRPFVSAQAGGPSGIANAVVTTLVWNTPGAAFNAYGMFNPATPTVFTLSENGSYAITFWVANNTATTITSVRAAILVAGVEIAWQRWAGATNAGPEFEISGIAVGATAGQQVTFQKVFTGTGTTNYGADQIYIVKISDS